VPKEPGTRHDTSVSERHLARGYKAGRPSYSSGGRGERACHRWVLQDTQQPEAEGAAAAPMDSGMNLPTSSFRSQDDASRAIISTIFLRIRRIWLVWA